MPPQGDPSGHQNDPADAPPDFIQVGRTVYVGEPGEPLERHTSTGKRFGKKTAAKDPNKVRREYKERKKDGRRVLTVFYYERVKTKKKPPGSGTSDPAPPTSDPGPPPPPTVTPGPIPDGKHPKKGSPPVVVSPPGGSWTPWGTGPPFDGIIAVEGRWYAIQLGADDVVGDLTGDTPTVVVKGGGTTVELTWTAPEPSEEDEEESADDDSGQSVRECRRKCERRLWDAWIRGQRTGKSQESQDAALKRIQAHCKEECGG